jgi:hypothetical protein
MKFPWAKGTTLQQAVIAGIPSKLDPAAVEEAKRQLRAEAHAREEARQTQLAAKQARAAAKREQAYAARAVRREAIIKNLVSKMTAVELGRWGKLIDTIRGQGVKRNTTSRDMRIDLGICMPPEILERAGLKPDADNVAAPKDPWRNRATYPTGLTRDDQPASDANTTVTAQMIIDAAAKARGDVPESKQIDPGRSTKSSERWNRK